MEYVTDYRNMAHQAAFDFAKEPCLLTTERDGRILAVNRALLRAFNVQEEDLLGKNVVEAGFWESEGQRNSFLSCLAIEGSLYHYPIRIVRQGAVGQAALKTSCYLDVERIEEAPEGLLFVRVFSASNGLYQSFEGDNTHILEFLYRTSTRFFLDDSSDLYPYIARELHSLVPNSYVAVSTWNEKTRLMQIRQLSHPDHITSQELNAIVAELHPLMRVIDDEDYRRLSSGTFFPSSKVYSETNDSPQRDTWLSILPVFRRLGIRSLWHIGLSWGGRLFGVVSIFLRSGDVLPEKTLIETFVRQASVALQRNERSEALAASLHEKETLLREIHHRVKNNLQIISSLLQLQTDVTRDEFAVQVLSEAADRVQSMALVHTMLYNSDSLSSVDTAEYLRLLATQIVRSGRDRGSGVELYFDLQDIRLDADRLIPLGLIVNELVTNALKYGVGIPGPGRLTLSLEVKGDMVQVSVHDTGGKLPEDFNIDRSGTLGMQLISGLTHQLGGVLSWSRDAGTSFMVEFPRKELSDASRLDQSNAC